MDVFNTELVHVSNASRGLYCWLAYIASKARNNDLSWGQCKFLLLPSKSRTLQKLSEALKPQSAAARRPLAGLAKQDLKKSKTVQLTTASGEILDDARVLKIVAARGHHQINMITLSLCMSCCVTSPWTSWASIR